MMSRQNSCFPLCISCYTKKCRDPSRNRIIILPSVRQFAKEGYIKLCLKRVQRVCWCQESNVTRQRTACYLRLTTGSLPAIVGDWLRENTSDDKYYKW